MTDDAGRQGHSHLVDFPEALEALFGRMSELRLVLGPTATVEVDRIESLLREGLAARQRGDAPGAVARIAAAMETLAAVASRVFPGEGDRMRGMVARFEQALGLGALGEAKEAADVMRERSGSRLTPKKER